MRFLDQFVISFLKKIYFLSFIGVVRFAVCQKLALIEGHGSHGQKRVLYPKFGTPSKFKLNLTNIQIVVDPLNSKNYSHMLKYETFWFKT